MRHGDIETLKPGEAMNFAAPNNEAVALTLARMISARMMGGFLEGEAFEESTRILHRAFRTINNDPMFSNATMISAQRPPAPPREWGDRPSVSFATEGLTWDAVDDALIRLLGPRPLPFANAQRDEEQAAEIEHTRSVADLNRAHAAHIRKLDAVFVSDGVTDELATLFRHAVDMGGLDTPHGRASVSREVAAILKRAMAE